MSDLITILTFIFGIVPLIISAIILGYGYDEVVATGYRSKKTNERAKDVYTVNLKYNLYMGLWDR